MRGGFPRFREASEEKARHDFSRADLSEWLEGKDQNLSGEGGLGPGPSCWIHKPHTLEHW